MKRPIPALSLLALAALLAPVALFAAGGSSAPTPTPRPSLPELTPEQKADAAYNRGLELRDKAWSIEDQNGDAKKIEKVYRKAAKRFEDATNQNPKHHQAWSSLGYALRKLGEYEDSLAAYDTALELAPTYTEAIEYRAEAYLGLNRLDDAKEAYMHLFSLDRQRADELMTAMVTWLENRKADPDGVDAETLEAFDAWVVERTKLADQTASLTQLRDRVW
ncbi:MAG: tetratricopeptide repeat protein [Acidobacteriota bacterium]